MSWFFTILIGLLTAVAGGAAGLFIGSICVRWYRISSFEGGAGYYVLFIGIAGVAVGFFTGIIASRVVASWPDANFLRGFGASMGSVVVLGLVILAICRLFADLPPEMDGQSIELEVQIRCARGYKPTPSGKPQWDQFASIYLPYNSRRERMAELNFEQMTESDGRWTISSVIPIVTRTSDKFLRVRFDEQRDLLFPLPLRSNPKRSDLEWTDWKIQSWDANKPKPGPDELFSYRSRVRIIPPPPPQPTAEELERQHEVEEDAKFAALSQESSLDEWLPYVAYGMPEKRAQPAMLAIAARPNLAKELTERILSSDTEKSADTLRFIDKLPAPPAELDPVMKRCGQLIAEDIRKFNPTPVEEDPSYQGAANVSIRFNAWMEAARYLREKRQLDLSPELGEILKLSRERPDSIVMRGDVCRVASYWYQQWTGTPPAPDDPPPR